MSIMRYTMDEYPADITEDPYGGDWCKWDDLPRWRTAAERTWVNETIVLRFSDSILPVIVRGAWVNPGDSYLILSELEQLPGGGA